MKPKILAILIVVMAILLVACGGTKKATNDTGQTKEDLAQQNTAQAYVPKSGVEAKNYDDRNKIADNPTTILFCTFYPPTPGVKPFTVAIVQKLTSSGKRPAPSTKIQVPSHVTDGYSYTSELPDQWGMFGSSSEYRFGFTPTKTYADFTDLPSFCSTELTDYAVQNTLVIETKAPSNTSVPVIPPKPTPTVVR